MRTESVMMISLAAALGGCGEGYMGATEVTYYGHAQPLLEAKCVGCHYEGGSAPMSLASYEDVMPWLAQIRDAVESGRMPPWDAAADCNQYLGDRSLDDAQKATLLAFVDAGGPEGNAGSPGEAVEVERSEFRTDLVLRMPEPYTPQITPDDYRCFLLPWPETAPVYITGVGLAPGNEALVHHSVVKIATPEEIPELMALDEADPGPGFTCFTGTVSDGSQLVGAIEKAEEGRQFPDGTGMRVEPGSMVVIQNHYNTLATGVPEPDRSAIELMLEVEVPRPARAIWFTRPQWFFPDGMPIPKGEADVTHEVTSGPGTLPEGFNRDEGFDIHWADLHMHTLGRSGELSVVRDGGDEACLLRIDDYHFDWQETFLLTEPVHFEPGDQLHLRCNWDNTADNQYVVDGERLEPVDVQWGDGSRDEMCLGNFLISQPE